MAYASPRTGPRPSIAPAQEARRPWVRTFDSDRIAEARRFGFYREVYANGADATLIGGPFRAEVQARRLDRLLAFDRRLKGLAHARSATRVRHDAFDHFTLQLTLSGEAHGDGGDGFQRIEPGAAVLMDMTRPVRSAFPCAHIVTLSVAREFVEMAAGCTDGLHGRVIPPERAEPLAAFVASLAADRLHTDDDDSADRVADLVEALGASLHPGGRPGRVTQGSVDRRRREKAMRFIARNIASPDLEPAQIAAATGVSRATLYRVFEPCGGVAKCIRDARLIALCDRLAELSELRPFSELALACGFVSESHASRVFLEANGTRPGEFRASLLDGPADDGHRPLTRAVMADWFKAVS